MRCSARLLEEKIQQKLLRRLRSKKLLQKNPEILDKITEHINFLNKLEAEDLLKVVLHKSKLFPKNYCKLFSHEFIEKALDLKSKNLGMEYKDRIEQYIEDNGKKQAEKMLKKDLIEEGLNKKVISEVLDNIFKNY